MSNCKHTVTTTGQHYGYTGSVASHPYTDENRAAHGGITYTETCSGCGAQRSVNANGRHYEYSAWARPVDQRVSTDADYLISRREAQV